MLPPPMSQSSGIVESRTKKRKCSNEEDPTNSTDTSSLIPNSQECVDISSNNVLHGKRQQQKKILMNGKYIINVLDNLYW